MKTNEKNGKSVKFSSLITRMTIDLINQYEYIKSQRVINADVVSDYKRFIELDKKLLIYNSAGLFDTADEVLDCAWELIALYGRIAAYKERLGEFINLEETFIYLIDDVLLDKIDYSLEENYKKESIGIIVYLCQHVLDMLYDYRISFKLDRCHDIVRIFTGDNTTGHKESEYIVKRYYLS